jgi:hypothetical protein
MNEVRSILFLLVVGLGIPTVVPASATTIPAGTILLMKTGNTIYSGDRSGTKFKGTLVQNIAGQGKTVIPSGTTVGGVVTSPKFTTGPVTRPLTLRLIEVVIHGRAVSIKTDDFEAKNTSPWLTRRGIQVTGARFLLPPGTILPFRLNQPLTI